MGYRSPFLFENGARKAILLKKGSSNRGDFNTSERTLLSVDDKSVILVIPISIISANPLDNIYNYHVCHFFLVFLSIFTEI